MEAFSDGVLAIAITLLVLDLALRPPGSPLEQFLRDWPSYLVYLVSFLTIGAAWIAHNSLTDDLDHVDRIFLRLNLLFLLSVSFLPFPTRIVGDALEKGTSWQRVAVTVFGLTVLATRLLFAAMAAYARREHLRRPVHPIGLAGRPTEVPRRRRRLRGGDRPRPTFPFRRDRALFRRSSLPRRVLRCRRPSGGHRPTRETLRNHRSPPFCQRPARRSPSRNQ